MSESTKLSSKFILKTRNAKSFFKFCSDEPLGQNQRWRPGGLTHGSYQKSVNTKVVPFNELSNIVIEHFPLNNCTSYDIMYTYMLVFEVGQPRFLIKTMVIIHY